MKKVQKTLALLLAAMMLLALAACGEPTVTTTDPPPADTTEVSDVTPADSTDGEVVPEEGASLKLWFDNDNYNEKIVELWNAKYPDIPLTVENVGTTDSRTKIELDGPTGMGADVFVQAHDGVAISAQSGNILEIDLFSDEIRSEFVENAINAVSYDGKIYAFPLSMKTIVMFYNKALVDTPVDTWAEMKEFSPRAS